MESKTSSMPERVSLQFFVTIPLSRWQRIRLRLSWAYWRQTRLPNPITEWWLNRDL